MKGHYRKGHWAQQPHGPRNSLRKPIYRKPKLVGSQKKSGSKSQ